MYNNILDNKICKCCNGSFTVESTFIMCISIFVLSILFYCGIYFYGSYYYSTSALFLARRGMELALNDFDLGSNRIDWDRWSKKGVLHKLNYDFHKDELSVIKYFDTQTSVPMYLNNVSICMDFSEVKIQYENKLEVPFKNMFHIVHEMRNTNAEVKVNYIDNEELIRMCRGILYPFISNSTKE